MFFSKKNKIDNKTDLDKKLVYSLSKSRIPQLRQIKYLGKFLNTKEKWLMAGSLAVMVASVLFLSVRFYLTHLEIAPVKGGEYAEALVGSPRYINPLYSNFNDVDSDLSALIFSSLFKRDNGNLTNDLAKGHEISADGKTYIIKVRTDAKWSNGAKLTVDDIIFTFNTIEDPQFKSSLRAAFSGVDIEKIDEETIKFILSEPYAPFLELLTFNIMPQELWSQVSPDGAGLAEMNLKPVGSGPYKFKSLTKDKAGQIKAYALAANDDYYGEKSYINTLNFKFFGSAEEAIQALNDGAVDGIGYLPRELEDLLTVKRSENFYRLSLPEITALFINQKNNQALADVKVRQALALSIDKDEIIQNILSNNALSVNGPILPGNFAYNKDNESYAYNKDGASKLLDDAGWKIVEVTSAEIEKIKQLKAAEKDKVTELDEDKLAIGPGKWRIKERPLIIKLTTVETAENSKIIESIKKYWEEIGIKTVTETVAASQIQPDVIKPRNFEILFYGQIVGNDPDSYAFWHSSQIESGANISGYSNKEADQLLEDGRLTMDAGQRKERYIKFQQIITKDIPAIFMYSPFYTYAQNKNVKGFSSRSIISPSDRFSSISNWYIKTGNKIKW